MNVISLLISAGVVGCIVAVMTAGDFPGWGPTIGCVLGMSITAGVVSMLLPDGLWFLGVAAGAAAGAWLISWLCSLPLRKGVIAAGTYLGLRVLLGLVLSI